MTDYCDICKRPIDVSDDATHFGHEEDCFTTTDGCSCNLIFHHNCCPKCNPNPRRTDDEEL